MPSKKSMSASQAELASKKWLKLAGNPTLSWEKEVKGWTKEREAELRKRASSIFPCDKDGNYLHPGFPPNFRANLLIPADLGDTIIFVVGLSSIHAHDVSVSLEWIEMTITNFFELANQKRSSLAALNKALVYLRQVDLIEYDCIPIPRFVRIRLTQKGWDIARVMLARTDGMAGKDTSELDQRVVLASFMKMRFSEQAELAKQASGAPAEVFKIALSFPGEYRSYVSQVDEVLGRVFDPNSIFYDNRFQNLLARPNLDTYLQEIYRKRAELVVVFLCKEYSKKQWCGLEWRVVREMIMQKQDSKIMLMRFDQTEIPGLFKTDGYIDLVDISPREAALQIARRYTQESYLR